MSKSIAGFCVAAQEINASTPVDRDKSVDRIEFGSSSPKLPGKLTANASGSAGHQRMTSFESERVRVQFFARTGSSTRQTFSARIL